MSRFVFSYTKGTYTPVARQMLTDRGIYLRRKIPFTAQNVGKIRKNLAGNTLDLSRVW